jgi:predicted RNA-binding Zn ribbon-like protein
VVKTSERQEAEPGEKTFYLLGNRLALDFANTVVAPRGHGDALRSWESLLDFLVAAGEVAPERAGPIKGLGASERGETRRVLGLALHLRDAVRAMVEALSSGQMADPASVDAVNDVLRVTDGHDELARAGAGWRLAFVPREQRLEWLLAGVARSAAELAVEGPGAPVRKCGNPKCVLYFYDSSRTGRRRWCSMAACGNRSKVAAFALRKKRRRRG